MAATATDQSSTSPWILLSEALALAAAHAGADAAAKELLLHYLREGKIRWIYWKQEGVFDEEETYAWHAQHSRIRDRSNPWLGIDNRWWGFWIESDSPSRSRRVMVDWENNNATCIAPESLWCAASDYRLSLIQLHHDDVINVLRLVGRLPWPPEVIPSDEEVAEPVQPAPTGPPPAKSSPPVQPTAKPNLRELQRWVFKQCDDNPPAKRDPEHTDLLEKRCPFAGATRKTLQNYTSLWRKEQREKKRT